MQKISEFVVGLLFGMGLLLSGMADPAKVLGWICSGLGTRLWPW